LIIVIAGFFITSYIYTSPSSSSNGNVKVEVELPKKTSNLYAANKLIAGVGYYYDARLTIYNLLNQNIRNLSIEIIVPEIMTLNPSLYSPSDCNISGNTVYLIRNLLNNYSILEIEFKVKTPSSIPYSRSEYITVEINYQLTGLNSTLRYNHGFSINPPPAWITYTTVIIGFVTLVAIIIIAKKTKILEKFSTIDLVNITILSSLGSIVFKWIWQIFNDFLGIFGGLLLSIPAAVLMIVAIYLVKKPGTATLFFLIWELLNFFVWGSNIVSWIGWYLLEGVFVDFLIVITKNYAENYFTASFLGFMRSFVAYWTTYFLFSPAIWKVYYAPWYVWLQIIIGCTGGIVGGILGFATGKKLEKATVAY
jgi:ABC-type thiamin/hydroxymethylpyrimidine transport system permease subunit